MNLCKKLLNLVKKMKDSKGNSESIEINLEEVFGLPKEHTQFLKDEEKYFKENFREIYQKYPEKYVAIRNHNIIDSSDEEKTLINRLYKSGEKRLPTYVVKVTRQETSPIPMRTPIFK